MTQTGRKLLAAVLALVMAAAACGDNGDSSSDTALADTVEATATSAVSAPESSTDTSDSGHDHDHDHGEHHNHDTVIEVAESLPVPTITIQVTEDPASGWNLRADVTDFEIVPENASTTHVDGQGHMHLYINGEKISRLYGQWHHIDSLQPGENLIRVELSANDHSPMALDGEIIDDSVVVLVPEADTAGAADSNHDHDHDDHEHEGHDHGTAGEATPWDAELSDAAQTIEVEVLDGETVGGTQRVKVELGSVVALRVNSNIKEEVHVHGYDILRALDDGQPAHFAFRADIPGVFEVELEGSGQLLRMLEIS